MNDKKETGLLQKIDIPEKNVTWGVSPFNLFFYKDNENYEKEKNKDWRELLRED